MLNKKFPKRILSLLAFHCILINGVYSQNLKLETVIQKGHNATVKAVAVSKDGKFLATGSRDRSVKIWDVETERELRSLLGAELTLNSVAFNPSGNNLAATSADGTMRVWEVNTGKEIYVSPKETKYLTSVAFNHDGSLLAYAGYPDSAYILNTNSWEVIKKIAVNADQGSGIGINLQFSPDGKYLSIGEDNRTAKIYLTNNWTLLYTLTPKEGWCGGCGTFTSFSNDSRYLVRLPRNTKPEIFDLNTGERKLVIEKYYDDVTGVAFLGDTMIATSNRESIHFWNASNGAVLDSFKLAEKPEINEIAFNSSGTHLYTAEDGNVAVEWDLRTGSIDNVFSGILNDLDNGGLDYDPNNYWESYIARYLRLKNMILLSPDGKNILKGKSGTLAQLWDITSGEALKNYSGHTKAVICFDYSKDGKLLVTGDGAGKAILWDVATGKPVKTFDSHREPLFEVKFNPESSELTTASWDGTVCIWNYKTGEKISTIDLDNSSAYSLNYAPGGLYLVTGRLGKSLDLWETDSKTIVRSFIGHTDVVSSIAFGPDPKLMLTASWDGSARLWDITTGMMVKKFKGNQGALHACLFSNDGKNILTAGDDRKIRIYNISTGKEIKVLEGHQAEITSLDLSSDGTMLASASLDGSVKFWDLLKGKEFFEHITLSDGDWMARTSEGYFNATPGAREMIHFVKGMENYGADQFFDMFFRPELLPEIFKTRGATGHIQKMDEVLVKSPPPVVKIAANILDDHARAVVHIKIINSGGGVDEIKLLHNGKAIPFDASRIVMPMAKEQFVVYTDTFTLVGGTNTFAVTGFSKSRVESPVSEVRLFSEMTERSAVCHVMVIGIDKYKNTNLSLNYAREDAEAFADVIQHKGKNIFEKVVVHALFDEQATRKNILDTLDSISEIIYQHDVFLFFYAGHGSMTEEKFYFIPNECTRLYETEHLSKEALEASLLQEKFTKIKALKQIIILDACHAGGSVELLSTRGALQERAIAQLSRSAGIHVLASAGSEQTAKELKELSHGLFTFVLLQALNGGADGAPHDGKITVYELKSYLDDQVPTLNEKYTGKPQYPYTFSRGHDFPIVVEE